MRGFSCWEREQGCTCLCAGHMIAEHLAMEGFQEDAELVTHLQHGRMSDETLE